MAVDSGKDGELVTDGTVATGDVATGDGESGVCGCSEVEMEIQPVRLNSIAVRVALLTKP